MSSAGRRRGRRWWPQVPDELLHALDPDGPELADAQHLSGRIQVGVVVHELVGPVPQVLLVLGGDAEQLADDHGGDDPGEVAQVVEPSGAGDLVEPGPAQPADPVLQLADRGG